ncbi:unnamed protein product [Cyprideis torosa]|uniref:Uncharacterized protein n=1 Tax=Cyprideis torosa TaxID=163714 RepID=A0A7R8W517_9CRUS|nr:unnamed protein product [Cyprideis torosa]CAG0879380.1 unnamed protein product [Cyprideis torosa]
MCLLIHLCFLLSAHVTLSSTSLSTLSMHTGARSLKVPISFDQFPLTSAEHPDSSGSVVVTVLESDKLRTHERQETGGVSGVKSYTVPINSLPREKDLPVYRVEFEDLQPEYFVDPSPGTVPGGGRFYAWLKPPPKSKQKHRKRTKLSELSHEASPNASSSIVDQPSQLKFLEHVHFQNVSPSPEIVKKAVEVNLKLRSSPKIKSESAPRNVIISDGDIRKANVSHNQSERRTSRKTEEPSSIFQRRSQESQKEKLTNVMEVLFPWRNPRDFFSRLTTSVSSYLMPWKKKSSETSTPQKETLTTKQRTEKESNNLEVGQKMTLTRRQDSGSEEEETTNPYERVGHYVDGFAWWTMTIMVMVSIGLFIPPLEAIAGNQVGRSLKDDPYSDDKWFTYQSVIKALHVEECPHRFACTTGMLLQDHKGLQFFVRIEFADSIPRYVIESKSKERYQNDQNQEETMDLKDYDDEEDYDSIANNPNEFLNPSTETAEDSSILKAIGWFLSPIKDFFIPSDEDRSEENHYGNLIRRQGEEGQGAEEVEDNPYERVGAFVDGFAWWSTTIMVLVSVGLFIPPVQALGGLQTGRSLGQNDDEQ